MIQVSTQFCKLWRIGKLMENSKKEQGSTLTNESVHCWLNIFHIISKNSFISMFSKSINKISTIYIHIVFEYIPSARLASATNLLTKFFINSFCSFHHLQKNAVSTWMNRLVGKKYLISDIIVLSFVVGTDFWVILKCFFD